MSYPLNREAIFFLKTKNKRITSVMHFSPYKESSFLNPENILPVKSGICENFASGIRNLGLWNPE